MAMRTDQQIIDDFGLSNTTLAQEKGNCPPNFNQSLLLEVLLNIRTYMAANNDLLDEIKEELAEIKDNTAS